MPLRPLARNRTVRAFALGFILGAATIVSPLVGFFLCVCFAAILLPRSTD